MRRHSDYKKLERGAHLRSARKESRPSDGRPRRGRQLEGESISTAWSEPSSDASSSSVGFLELCTWNVQMSTGRLVIHPAVKAECSYHNLTPSNSSQCPKCGLSVFRVVHREEGVMGEPAKCEVHASRAIPACAESTAEKLETLESSRLLVHPY